MAWNCSAANDIWANSFIPKHKWSRFKEDIHQLWDKIVTSLEGQDIEKVAIILRLIWLKRNEFVFQRILKSSDRLIQITTYEHGEF